MKPYSIVEFGKELQKYGLNIGENPAFGSGKVGKHSPGSYHYAGKAIDVTDWRPDIAPAYEGGKPIPWQQRTGELAYRARKSGLFTEAIGPEDPAHKTHVHLALKDKVTTTPEMVQWIATGRYKTPEGKLTDVMPGFNQQASPQAAQPPSTQTPGGDTYIFVSSPKQKAKETLASYIQNKLQSSVDEYSPVTLNLATPLMNQISQTLQSAPSEYYT